MTTTDRKGGVHFRIITEAEVLAVIDSHLQVKPLHSSSNSLFHTISMTNHIRGTIYVYSVYMELYLKALVVDHRPRADIAVSVDGFVREHELDARAVRQLSCKQCFVSVNNSLSYNTLHYFCHKNVNEKENTRGLTNSQCATPPLPVRWPSWKSHVPAMSSYVL